MKKAWWEYVLDVTEKVRSATKWGFEKARDFVVEIQEDDPKENQVDAFEKEQEKKNENQTSEITSEPVFEPEAEIEPVKSNDSFADVNENIPSDKKEESFYLDDILKGLSPKSQLFVLRGEKQKVEAKLRDPNNFGYSLCQRILPELDKRIKALEQSKEVHQDEKTDSDKENRPSDLNKTATNHEKTSDSKTPEMEQPNGTPNTLNSRPQSLTMDSWIQSEKNFQNRVMAEQKRREGLVDQDVVVSNEGVTLSPYAQMLFGKKENANFESSVEPRFDQEAETPKPKSVSDHTEKQEISNFEVVEEKALPSVDSDKEQGSTSSSKQKNRDVIVDVPYEVARTRLTPTQQKIIQAGVSKRKQSSEESITPEAKESIQNVSLKELIHQAAVTHEKAMSEVKERLEKEPVPEIVLPKRRRKKPKKSLLQRVVDRDNNSVRVVETKTQQDQVIQEGNLTRTIHIQQVKTDMLITETMPVSSSLKMPEGEAKGLPGASMKKKPMPKKQKSAKGATPKSAPKKTGGSRRGVNMDRMSLLLKNLKEKGIAK